MNKDPKQDTVDLEYLVENVNFTIPPYQRPYKWTRNNVVQLLEDIFEYVVIRKKNYRVGSIILLDKNSEMNIIDGQQRLTTISLLLKLLDNKFDTLLLKKEYKHKISKNNIVNNYNIIDSWLNTKFKSDEKTNFKNQILKKCEFILVIVYNQDEAFQLFDSQNARGKELEPYDLLKAFHLREMQLDTEDNRIKCVESWEESIDKNELKPVMANHLFKIRKWSKNELKYDFTKNDIDEFKGISLHLHQKYPFEYSLRMLDGFVDNAQNDKFLRNLHIGQSFPFSITMQIINGKRFFEYIDFYINLKNKLIDKEEMPELYSFYKKYCLYDSSYSRSGDIKICNFYENILMLFADKFGTENLSKDFYEAFYKLAYEKRCNQVPIGTGTILKLLDKNIFLDISYAINIDRLKHFQYKKYKIEKNENEMVKGIGHIKKFINGDMKDESN